MYIRLELNEKQAAVVESALLTRSSKMLSFANSAEYRSLYGIHEAQRCAEDADILAKVADGFGRYRDRIARNKDIPVIVDLL